VKEVGFKPTVKRGGVMDGESSGGSTGGANRA